MKVGYKVINIKDVSKQYDDKMVLKDITFDINAGDFVGIMGASGSGKTTLLNILSTIDNDYEGIVEYGGVDISKLQGKNIADFRNSNIGIIFQDYNLLDCLTVYENIIIALTFMKISKKEQQERVLEISGELGIQDILEKYPHEISGGQCQRVACARAMVKKPSIILADEPTGALDTAASRALLKTLKMMNDTFKVTILMVTHDPLTASYCKKIYFMNDGRIVKEMDRGEEKREKFFADILEELLERDSNEI